MDSIKIINMTRYTKGGSRSPNGLVYNALEFETMGTGSDLRRKHHHSLGNAAEFVKLKSFIHKLHFNQHLRYNHPYCHHGHHYHQHDDDIFIVSYAYLIPPPPPPPPPPTSRHPTPTTCSFSDCFPFISL
ncbi:unnamed protein product [Trichobilharzia regenti]|nr:unnamed protein product [Trichobilharzia regenti]